MRFFYESSSEDEDADVVADSRKAPAGKERQKGNGRLQAAKNGSRKLDKGKGKERAESNVILPRSLSKSTRLPPSRLNSKQPSRRTSYNASFDSEASASSSSASSSSAASSSGGSSGEDDSEDDSEEDEFPVGPDAQDGRRRLNKYPAYTDPLEVYYEKEQQKAWERAQAAHHRDLVALRTIRINAFSQAAAQRASAQRDDVEQVRLFLESFDLQRQREEEQIDRDFDLRNKERWAEINAAIAKLEESAKAAAEQRRKQVELEEQARARREEELEKVKREEERERERKQRERDESEKREEEERRKEEADRERKEKEEAGKAAIGKPAGGASLPSGGSGAAAGTPSANMKGEWERWTAKMKDIKTTVLPAVSSNPTFRSACYQLKKKLSTRISNISASASDISSKAAEISSLLNDSKATRETYEWSLNLLSKRIIGMANMSNDADLSPVTFALASLVVALLVGGHEGLAEFLMARFVKRCPYVLPYHPLRGQMSQSEHNKLLGRKEDESTINYSQRMSGIIGLYAAICQTSPSAVPSISPSSNPSAVPAYFRPSAGWAWLALILRDPLPRLEVTPLLLYSFLRMSGERFYALYGRQYVKLLRAITDQAIDRSMVQWNPNVQGDISKVRIMLGEWIQNGRVEGAKGRIPQ